MAKKTIKDLRIGDVIWKHQDIYNPIPLKITELSVHKVSFEGADYHLLKEGDKTLWRFKSERYSNLYFLNELDALKEQRKALDKQMEYVFKKQQDFYKKIMDVNEAIRECDKAIAKQLIFNPNNN